MKNKEPSECQLLAKKYGMRPEHFHADKRGFITVTRRGIEYLQSKLSIHVEMEPVFEWSNQEAGAFVFRATAYKTDHTRRVVTYGESSPKNNRNAYPVAMAEKRALSRAVLKLTGLSEEGVMGEDEPNNTLESDG